jgi:similar to stage IV sporulation protein
MAWRSMKLPFGRVKDTIWEVETQELTLSEEEAKETGLNQARADILAKNGLKTVIKAENILQERTENGKVVMKVLFEVEQQIAGEQPLVYE